jgi:DNA-binding transcriptional LysR family regulator
MTNPRITERDESTLAMLASVNLNLLVPLMALLEEKSVTLAADRVGLSQPAMSHALKKIRALLGDELLVRQSSGMELTPRALELMEPLTRALHQAATLVSASGFTPLTDRRTVTIAMTTSTAFVLAGPLSLLLAERAPNMTLKIKTGNLTAPSVFTDDGVDATLLTETLPSPHPRERLFDDRWVVISSPGVELPQDPRTLVETQPHIVFEDPLRRLGSYLALDQAGITYRTAMRVTDYLLVPYLVARSHAVAMHRLQVTLELADSLSLGVSEFPIPIQTIGVDLVWNPWLVDEEFKAWLRQALFDVSAPLRERYAQHSNI